MKHFSILFILIGLPLIFFGQTEIQRHAEVEIFLPQNHLSYLQQAGFEFDHGSYNHHNQSYTTILTAKEVERLDALGYPYQVKIADVTLHFLDNNVILSKEEVAQKIAGISCNQINYPVPNLFPYPGTMGGYLTFAAYEAALDTLYAYYPGLMSQKQSIGTTHEGRNLWMFRISDNPEIDENEPEILYTGMHHAREPMSIAVPLYFACYLLENYTVDQRIKDLVDHTEMYFVPCINPDGYVYNQTIAPNGGGLWRKNRRDNQDGTFGVDLNRNYGYEWGYNNSGSSPSTSSSTYRGDSAFSEPETQAIKAFVESREFRMAFNHHSYSELLLKVYGYDNVNPPATDNATYDFLGNDLVQHNTYNMGSGLGTLGYYANGNSDDWMYGEQTTKEKVFAYTPEIGKSFWPSASQIIPLCSENMYTCLRAAYLAGNYADLQDWSSANVTDSSGFFPFRINRSGLEDSTGFIIRLIPLENVAVAGPPVSTGIINYQQKFDGSIFYQLAPGLASGSTIQFIWELDNGNYTLRDTITKFYNPDVIFEDDCETFTNWSAIGSWSTTTAEFFNGSASLTDSDGGNYSPATSGFSTLYLNVPLDLSNASAATMTFWTKYHTVLGEDYVQVAASTSGTGAQPDYVPLCGKASRPGTKKDLPTNQPIYHGIESEWIREEISLDDFVGESSVGIRFRLFFNSGQADDGFYLDDIAVVAKPGIPCACVIPDNATNASVTCNSVSLQWDPISCVDGYTIRGRRTGEPNWLIIDIPDQTTTSFNTNVLACNTDYEWQIRSVCNAVQNTTSSWSTLQTFTTGNCTAPVSNFSSNLTDMFVTLNWDTVACAAGYQIEGGLVGSGATVSIIVPGSGTSFYDVSGLNCNEFYTWRISSICFCQNYVFSEATLAQTFNTMECQEPIVKELTDLGDAHRWENTIRAFPNPGDGLFHIRLPKNYGSVMEVNIFDMKGASEPATVLKTVPGIISIDLNHRSTGLYFLELRNYEGEASRVKVMKN